MTLPSVPVPAAMPSRGDVQRCLNAGFRDGDEFDNDQAARAILDLFAPILAEKERAVRDSLREVAKWAAEAGEAQGRLKASEMAGIVEGWRERALAAEASLAGEREELRIARKSAGSWRRNYEALKERT